MGAPPPHQETLFAPPAGGERRPATRPQAVVVPNIARISVPRATSGLSASVVDVLAGNIGNVQPLLPRTYWPVLVQLCIHHPLMRQAVELFIANANSGHSFVFDVPDGADQLAQQCEDTVNDLGRRVDPGGFDALINSGIFDLASMGALSLEDVVRSGVHVERIVQVPPQDIEFMVPKGSDDGTWVAYQRAGAALKELDPRTYRYLPMMTVGNNPWGVPPFVAALDAIIRESRILDQLDAVLAKSGWLGFLALEISRRDGIDVNHFGTLSAEESERQFRDYMQRVLNNFSGDYRSGAVGLEKGIEFKYQAPPPVTSTGAEAIYNIVARMICAGLGIDPSMLGFEWTNTETWRGGAMSLFDARCAVMQRILATRFEMSLTTECRLKGLPVAPWMQFTPRPNMRPMEQAQADALRTETAIKRALHGLLSPDAAAQEAGYDTWHDPERLFTQGAMQASPFGFRKPQGMRFRFDRVRCRYVHERPALSAPSLTTHPPSKAARCRARMTLRATKLAKGPGDAALKRIVERLVNRYAGKIGPELDRVQAEVFDAIRRAVKSAPEMTPDELAIWIDDKFAVELPKAFDARGDEVLQRVLDVHAEMAEEWDAAAQTRSAGKTVAKIDPELTLQDVTALAGSDVHHVSIYLPSLSGEGRAAIQKVIAEQVEGQGRDITDPDVMDEILNRLERSDAAPLMRRREHGREGADTETDEEARDRMASRIRRVVDTSVIRSRTVRDVRILGAMEVESYRIVRQGSEACPICSEHEGDVVRVADATAYIDDFLAMSPEDQERTLTEQRGLSAAELREIPGAVQPPLHPNCVCTVEADE